ncbi:MAG: BTAD domain-containing putative transcriptional regulator, partial [Anaerolineae bacterium]
MAHLDLTLFGPFQLTLDHQVIERFESNKVRALLAFLAVEHRRPHSREALAELLWPGHTIEAARGNFRRALANLRAVLNDQTAQPPYLHITREALQFNLAADVTVDAVRFLALAQTPESQPGWASNLEQALALYRGPFLEGFHADDCQEFEQWITAGRSELEQLAARALFWLAQHDHVQGDLAQALPRYRRCLALNPYDEAAQRGLMLALVDSDQHGAALARYAAYR